jgi:phosphopantothenoylcysteine decarboxylase/phosphopantothenate--cysteine ligase
MNVNMFEHPAVQENLAVLRSRGVGVVEPGSGYLACGWLGKGRLAETGEIVDAAMAVLQRRRDLEGETVLVTAGPTVEDIDPVRFISNRSSGKMGYRLAEVARDRGARVILLSGPTSLPAPAGVELVSVRSAEEMARAVEEHAVAATIVVGAAAVSDFRPASVASSKVKKTGGGLALELMRTRDILAGLGRKKGSRLLVGFAAETDGLLENARKKLESKNLDLIVANDVKAPGAGFGADTNAAILLRCDGGRVDVPLVSKRELAERILDEVHALRAGSGRATLPKKARRGRA